MKIDLLAYMRNQEIGDEYLWKQAAIDQEIFMRDVVCSYMLHVPCFVISGHRSKSISLPVYGFTMRNGVKVIARYNFYDWKLSIELPGKLPEGCYIPEKIFGEQNGKIPDCYLEGFRQEWSYDIFTRDATKFTVEICSKYNVYMLLYILNNIFPEKTFDINSDNRTASEIEKSIINIYERFGVYEKQNKIYPGEKEPRNLMSGWEVLYITYHIISNYKWYEAHDLKYKDIMNIADEPYKFATFIVKYPDVHGAFLLEEYLYNNEF